MMRILGVIAFFLYALSAHAVQVVNLKVFVKDNRARPVVGAIVKGSFFQDEVVNQQRLASHQGITDAEGVVELSGTEDIYVDLRIAKPGYYSTEERVVVRDAAEKTVNVLLREVRNPIAMYAKSITLEIPDRATEYGVDLIKGDFVAPIGKGSHADIVIYLDRELMGDDYYSQTLSVDFPNPSDGFILMGVKDEWRNSEYKTDYLAPVTGYSGGLRVVTSRTASGYENHNTNRPFYLRIRSAADQKGNVKSAQYCKIWPSIEVLGALIDKPLVKMTYYCNPTPNDRNVEFDLGNNLLRNLKDEERPRAP